MVNVIGIGAHDDLEQARDFAESGGLSTVRLLWAQGIEAWQAFGVASQPAWAVLTREGAFVEGAFGVPGAEQILNLLSEI